jgi:hypothetical protein
MQELFDRQILGCSTGHSPVAASIFLVKVYTADAALILTVSPATHSETTATPWDWQSSFTNLIK